MRQLLVLLLSIPALISVGCMNSKSSYDMGASMDTGADSGSAGGTSSTDTASTVDTADTGAELPTPYWYGLDAEVVINSGAITDATFLVRVSGQDTSLSENCAGARGLRSAERLELSPDPTIYEWWSIETDPDDGSCEGADALPTSFYLGLGAMHVDVLPALTRAGLDSDALAEGLYGAYASIPGGDSFCGGESVNACVFGYAGTAKAFSGQSVAVTNPPIPDGVYGVTAAFYFPVP